MKYASAHKSERYRKAEIDNAGGHLPLPQPGHAPIPTTWSIPLIDAQRARFPYNYHDVRYFFYLFIILFK